MGRTKKGNANAMRNNNAKKGRLSSELVEFNTGMDDKQTNRPSGKEQKDEAAQMNEQPRFFRQCLGNRYQK